MQGHGEWSEQWSNRRVGDRGWFQGLGTYPWLISLLSDLCLINTLLLRSALIPFQYKMHLPEVSWSPCTFPNRSEHLGSQKWMWILTVQFMLMIRRGYRGVTERHIYFVSPVCRQHTNVIELWRSSSRSRRIRFGCKNKKKKKEWLNNVFSVKIRAKLRKISADVRCCILNSTASSNLTPCLSECLRGKEETWLWPSIIQCMCAWSVSVSVSICVNIVWLGNCPTLP